ncbi:hypothetical protein ACL03H_13380 [Saccharopolyspora sp. MS10]|uniref:hypothetical protein n=1 Tax=Saccharopolyspora sp. MS10 TaxID=3385973 RepID=UPI0039A3E942
MTVLVPGNAQQRPADSVDVHVHFAVSRLARRVRIPALLVGLALALAVLLLVGVSLFVEVPGSRIVPPTAGLGTAVNPTPLGSAVPGAVPGLGDAVFPGEGLR